jgi:hypothetical protein
LSFSTETFRPYQDLKQIQIQGQRQRETVNDGDTEIA